MIANAQEFVDGINAILVDTAGEPALLNRPVLVQGCELIAGVLNIQPGRAAIEEIRRVLGTPYGKSFVTSALNDASLNRPEIGHEVTRLATSLALYRANPAPATVPVRAVHVGRASLGTRGAVVAAVVLFGAGIATGAIAPSIVDAVGGTTIAEMAKGVWSCRAPRESGEHHFTMIIADGVWVATRQLESAVYTTDTGTWRLVDGRLELGDIALEPVPENAGDFDSTMTPVRRGGFPLAPVRVSYKDGKVTIIVQEQLYECTKQN